jgi:hypothetical protein
MSTVACLALKIKKLQQFPTTLLESIILKAWWH